MKHVAATITTQDAMARGQYKGHYAETTANEYWAEGTQWWRVYVGHHIPADIYHGRNIRPQPRRR